jgi:hypothetical protein
MNECSNFSGRACARKVAERVPYALHSGTARFTHSKLRAPKLRGTSHRHSPPYTMLRPRPLCIAPLLTRMHDAWPG